MPSHELLVTAYDSSASSRSTVTAVTINVEDEEDMVPVFPNNLYNSMVPENEVNYLIATVEVRRGWATTSQSHQPIGFR